MRYASLCSGIDAASVAWKPLGWSPVFFSEIEPFPRAVLAHHYPDVPNLGDMTKFKDWPDATFDVLVGGTPCQSFSVAGLRAGLDDPRGNLMLTFGAIAARYRPRWLVWENVPGVLSSNGGRDFGAFLGLLGLIGYGFAYRVLDAQYVRVDGYAGAVPQRRKRVFVVGCLGDWRRAAAVLLERESLRGDLAPRRSAGKGLASRPAHGTFSCGGIGSFSSSSSSSSLRASGADLGLGCETLIAAPHADLSPALKARDGKGPSSDGDGDGAILVPMVAHSLRADGFDASEGGTGRGTPLVPVSVALRGREGGATIEIGDDAAFALRASSGGGDKAHALVFDTTQITSAANYSNPQPGDQCHPLAAGAHPPAIAFSCKDHAADHAADHAPTMRAMGHAGSHANGGGQLAVAYSATDYATGSFEPVSASRSLTTSADRTRAAPIVGGSMQVRRLTPVECARLQGFPDNYLDITYRGKPAADGPKYKALGNSMAVNCMRWIGMRIALVDEIGKEPAA